MTTLDPVLTLPHATYPLRILSLARGPGQKRLARVWAGPASPRTLPRT